MLFSKRKARRPRNEHTEGSYPNLIASKLREEAVSVGTRAVPEQAAWEMEVAVDLGTKKEQHKYSHQL